MPDHFDLIVLGSGSSGSTVAKKASEYGMSVAIVENREFGGTCALRGCNPKKVLTRSAEYMDLIRTMDGRLIRKGNAHLDWSTARQFQRTFVDPVPESEKASLEEAGVETFQGEPTFTGPRKLEVGGRPLTADRFVIATGSKPSPLDLPGFERLTTSDEFLFLDDLPKSIVFLGGGVHLRGVRDNRRGIRLRRDGRGTGGADP